MNACLVGACFTATSIPISSPPGRAIRNNGRKTSSTSCSWSYRRMGAEGASEWRGPVDPHAKLANPLPPLPEQRHDPEKHDREMTARRDAPPEPRRTLPIMASPGSMEVRRPSAPQRRNANLTHAPKPSETSVAHGSARIAAAQTDSVVRSPYHLRF